MNLWEEMEKKSRMAADEKGRVLVSEATEGVRATSWRDL